MATVPTIVTGTSPVTIQAYGNQTVTYNQILSQLGTYNFKVNKISVISSNYANLYIPLIFQKTDSSGNINEYVVNVLPSQYQRVTQVDLDVSKYGIIFDSQTFLNLTVNPSSSLTMLFDTTQWSNTGLLDNTSKL